MLPCSCRGLSSGCFQEMLLHCVRTVKNCNKVNMSQLKWLYISSFYKWDSIQIDDALRPSNTVLILYV